MTIVRRLPSSELYHHGIKGQKWGIRRYQNADRTLTSAGKARYSKGNGGSTSREISPETKKKLKIAAAAVAGLTLVGASAYLGYRYGMKVPKTKKPKMDLSNKTDKELQEMVKRMKLEKQIKDMSREPKKRSKIQVDDTLIKVANATLLTTASGVTGYVIRSAITGEGNREMLADYVAPKPGGKKRR